DREVNQFGPYGVPAGVGPVATATRSPDGAICNGSSSSGTGPGALSATPATRTATLSGRRSSNLDSARSTSPAATRRSSTYGSSSSSGAGSPTGREPMSTTVTGQAAMSRAVRSSTSSRYEATAPGRSASASAAPRPTAVAQMPASANLVPSRPIWVP